VRFSGRDSSGIYARYYAMEETRLRRLSIARELLTWGVACPTFSAVSRQRRKTPRFPDVKPPMRIRPIRNYTTDLSRIRDRLRELIATAKTALELVLTL